MTEDRGRTTDVVGHSLSSELRNISPEYDAEDEGHPSSVIRRPSSGLAGRRRLRFSFFANELVRTTEDRRQRTEKAQFSVLCRPSSVFRIRACSSVG
jgi:hypothetical protein